MVQRIGGEDVAVTTLVGPDGDTHVYRPTPGRCADHQRGADPSSSTGLQFEGWLDRLIDTSDFRGVRVVATDGIEPIAYAHGADSHARDGEADHDAHAGEADHDAHADGGHHDGHNHGGFDPHAWQSLRNAAVYVDSITAALATADPGNASAFYRNREALREGA